MQDIADNTQKDPIVQIFITGVGLAADAHGDTLTLDSITGAGIAAHA